MKSTISEKGQVTIPKRLRDRLGIRPGDELDFTEVDGRLMATKQVAEDPLERVYGAWSDQGWGFSSTEEFMAWARPHRFGTSEERDQVIDAGPRDAPS